MPITPGCKSRRGQHDAAPVGRRRRRLDAAPTASSSISRSIAWRARFSSSSAAASRSARAASSVVSSSTERVASASRPPALRRGARRKPTAPVDICATPLTRLERHDAGPVAGRQLAQAVLHQHAVLLDHGHEVGDGAERDQIEVAAQVGQPDRRSRAAACARPWPDRRRRRRRTGRRTESRRRARSG